MKNDTVEITVKIEIPIQMVKYLYDLCNKSESESTEYNDSVVSIKPNNITIIPETVSDNRKLQSNTHIGASYKLYDTNPALFLDLYDEYMNGELTASEIAKLLGCSIYTFRNAIKYYRDKENVHENKHRTATNKNLAKYNIYDEKPKEFIEVYNKFTNKEIRIKEAARLLGISVSTFYRSIKYYEHKTGIENFG